MRDTTPARGRLARLSFLTALAALCLLACLPGWAEATPRVYVMVTVRNKDPQFPGSADYAADKAAYQSYRAGVLEYAAYLEQNRVLWEWQHDWNFLQGVIEHEVLGQDPTLLAETGGDNVIEHLSQHGAAIGLHSHERDGYNYADVAHLVRQTGVEPSPVVGGHIWDASSQAYSRWPRFADGIAGKKYGGQASFKAEVLMGGSTFGHQQEPKYSGVWRPASESDFHSHDPEGKLVAVGNWPVSMLGELLSKLQDGSLSGMYVATFDTNSHALSTPGYIAQLEQRVFAQLLAYRDQGLVQFVHAEDIPGIWKSEYDEQAGIYGPEYEKRLGRGGRGRDRGSLPGGVGR